MKLCGKGLHDLDDPAIVTHINGRRRCGPCLREWYRMQYAANPYPKRALARKWAATNPERNRGNVISWQIANPEQRRAGNRNFMARRRAAIGDDHVSAADQAALLAQPCAYCGAPATELDHIVPLRPRAGEPAGRHVLANLAQACRDCNRSKSNLPLDVWLQRRSA